MGLNREWFEVFFQLVGISMIPACFGMVALAFPQGPREEGGRSLIYPKGLEAIGAAVVRVSGFSIVFMWIWGAFMSAPQVSASLSMLVVWMIILITSTTMALVGALRLSGESRTITAIGVLYFLLGALQTIIILRLIFW